MSRKPPPIWKLLGLPVGHRFIVIRDGRFVRKSRKKGNLTGVNADGKAAQSASAR
jgi:hypothetical protein